MSITDRENELFKRWADRRPDLVQDGVVDEEAYLASELKLVFVLKEVNSEIGNWDLREFLRNGGQDMTWNNITRWVNGIRNLEAEMAWQNLVHVSEQERAETLRSICVMNLKKSPGGGNANLTTLTQAVEQDKDLLKEQFRLYDGDVVICCGDGVDELAATVIGLDAPPDWPVTTEGVRFREYCPRKYLLSYVHPQARKSAHLLSCGLVAAVRELIHNGPADA